MTPGTIFEHKHWRDLKGMPLLCKVLAVRNGVVYWGEWEQPGIARRSRYWFDLGEAHRYVGQVLEGDHPGRPVLPEGAGG